MDNRKIFISWEKFHNDTQKLCKIIRDKELDIKGIVCLTRGGLVPTAIISSELNIRRIEAFAVKTYSDNHKADKVNEILSYPSGAIEDKGKGWIIIDELVDTGSTSQLIRSRLPHAYFFAVYTKLISSEILDGYISYFDPSVWIYFPWEKSL